MQIIPLSPIPNQAFSVTLSGNYYQFKVYLITSGAMACDIVCNSVAIVSGARLTPGEFLIPFFGYNTVNGNFLFQTQNYELSDYTQFGVSQTITYMTQAEIVAAVTI